MKLVFLDVDGVLNNDYTKEKIDGYTFVSDDKIVLLKEILDQTGAKIVLSSTWRRGWECKEQVTEPTPSDMQDIRHFEALQNKLLEYNIELMSYTEDFGTRGAEIDKWLSEWKGEPIESFIILDDMGGAEMRPHSLYLVQTGFREGLMPKHVQKAIKLLNEWDEPEIIRNRAKCLLCGDIIESKHRHDFKFCSCGALSVDGGLDYIRRSFKSEEAFKELSEYKK